MTTKPPALIKRGQERSLEAAAYASVAGIETLEDHDRDRLGYNVWRWLRDRRGTLASAVHSARARLTGTEEDAVKRIGEALRQWGIEP